MERKYYRRRENSNACVKIKFITYCFNHFQIIIEVTKRREVIFLFIKAEKRNNLQELHSGADSMTMGRTLSKSFYEYPYPSQQRCLRTAELESCFSVMEHCTADMNQTPAQTITRYSFRIYNRKSVGNRKLNLKDMTGT